MLTRRLDEDDEEILPPRRTAEREMTLGTGVILGIFFAVVLSWGVFFGFGYKLGSSTAKSLSNTDGTSPVTAATSPNFSAFKPSAGSPVAAGAPAGTAPGIAVRDNGGPVQTAPPAGAQAAPRMSTPAPNTHEDEPSAPPVAAHAAAPAAVPVAPSMPPVSASGAYVVQVAAVSHQEDADLLVNALHAKGYSVSARTEPGDKLVHIQVGPFRDKKDAEAMKTRLSGDGYNAYIK